MARDISTVDEYLDAVPQPRRSAVEHVRRVIHEVAPEATDRISYGIIVFRLHGDLVGLSAQKHHLSLHTMSPPLVKQMKDRLTGVKVSGATIHFDVDEPLSDDLLRGIVRARVAENEAKGKK